jgi:hypothetical protein
LFDINTKYLLISNQWRIYRGTGPPRTSQKKKKNKLNSYIFAKLAMLNIHREVEITVD